MGSRRKARECALQMLFAADVAEMPADEVVQSYWAELGESDLDETAIAFATRLASGTLANLTLLDERIRSRAGYRYQVLGKGQGQSLLILEAHGSYPHQIVAVDYALHISPVVLEAVDIRYMHGAQIIHMRCQRSQPQVRHPSDAIEIKLHHRGR